MNDAVLYTRQYYEEFPDNPSSLFALGTTSLHQQATSSEITDEIAECAKKVERLLSHASGNELWLRNTTLKYMHVRLRNLKEIAKKVQNTDPALRAAQTAISEYQKPDGDIVKAAHAIDEALKPELKHPNPQPMRALQGTIYFQWGKDVIETPDNSVVSGGARGLPDLAGVFPQEQPFLLVKEKFVTALYEFESCADFAFPRSMYDWNAGLALSVLNRLDEGCARCLESLRKRLEEQLVNADVTGSTKFRNVQIIKGRSTYELLFQLETAFNCANLLKNDRLRFPGRTTYHTRMRPMQQEMHSPSFAPTALR